MENGEEKEQNGSHKHKLECMMTHLEPMSFLIVSDLDGLGHQKPGSFVMELSLDTWLKNQRS